MDYLFFLEDLQGHDKTGMYFLHQEYLAELALPEFLKLPEAINIELCWKISLFMRIFGLL